MRPLLLIILAVGLVLPAYSQQKPIPAKALNNALFIPAQPEVRQLGNFWLRSLLRTDRQTVYRTRSPFQAMKANTNARPAESYWTSLITAQSFNNGKIGTYYYWDVQGNLRETRLFFDIAGKNKRGLKLVFPRR